MTRDFISPEEGAELKRLLKEWRAAQLREIEAAKANGMESEAYNRAAAETAAIVGRIKEIQGTTGRHWMA